MKHLKRFPGLLLPFGKQAIIKLRTIHHNRDSCQHLYATALLILWLTVYLVTILNN